MGRVIGFERGATILAFSVRGVQSEGETGAFERLCFIHPAFCQPEEEFLVLGGMFCCLFCALGDLGVISVGDFDSVITMPMMMYDCLS